MRIQELEHLTGMDRATIRFYEKEDLINPKRSENGYRNYTDENAAELKKIRLLRQLGMSVFTIKQLQQGSANFSETLTRQVKILSDQIEENKRAKVVCQTIYDDGAAYENLDADHYLMLLSQIQTNKSEFTEDVPRECHPWRRWFARTLDYWWIGTTVNFVIFVLLRIRPLPNEFHDTLITILTGALFVPIEAWMLSRWATSPGKLVMGIRVVSANGGNMTFREALERAWCVYQKGMWFCIPTLELFPQLRQYLRLTGRSVYRFARKEDIPAPEEMPWDRNTEIIYEPIRGRKSWLLASLIIITIICSVITGFDGIKPKYRSEELTVSQFADNYNQTMTLFQGEGHLFDTLNPDGSLRESDPNLGQVINHMDTLINEEQSTKAFDFEMEGDIVKSVTIRKLCHDNNIMHFKTMGTEEINLVFTALLSTPRCSLSDFWGIIRVLIENQSMQNAKFMYRDRIEIEWTIDTKNCVPQGTYYVTEHAGQSSSIYYAFTVRFP